MELDAHFWSINTGKLEWEVAAQWHFAFLKGKPRMDWNVILKG